MVTKSYYELLLEMREMANALGRVADVLKLSAEIAQYEAAQ